MSLFDRAVIGRPEGACSGYQLPLLCTKKTDEVLFTRPACAYSMGHESSTDEEVAGCSFASKHHDLFSKVKKLDLLM